MGVFSVVNWFLYKDSMTLLKLQILCYYAYAWSLVFLNKNENIKHKLFEDTFQGWAMGPNCQLCMGYRVIKDKDIFEYYSKLLERK